MQCNAGIVNNINIYNYIKRGGNVLRWDIVQIIYVGLLLW